MRCQQRCTCCMSISARGLMASVPTSSLWPCTRTGQIRSALHSMALWHVERVCTQIAWETCQMPPPSQPAAKQPPCNSGRGRGILKAQAPFRKQGLGHFLEAKPLYLLCQPDGMRSISWMLAQSRASVCGGSNQMM